MKRARRIKYENKNNLTKHDVVLFEPIEDSSTGVYTLTNPKLEYMSLKLKQLTKKDIILFKAKCSLIGNYPTEEQRRYIAHLLFDFKGDEFLAKYLIRAEGDIFYINLRSCISQRFYRAVDISVEEEEMLNDLVEFLEGFWD